MGQNSVNFPPTVDCRLPGWDLLWAELTVSGNGDALTTEREALPGRLRRILLGLPIPEHPTVRAVRSLFRNAGCDPTRYRPSSEALARRLEKGEALPAIFPAVDINNLWSVELMAPCCVVDPGKLAGTLTLRKGQPGETMESMRGLFNLEGKPTLVDSDGPFGTPITDSERVKVRKREGTFWLVAYLPKDVVKPEKAMQKLEEIVTRVGCAELRSA
jgi:DNA/RNA-binding domain of Phe-tRNA-synthetase-like protein